MVIEVLLFAAARELAGRDVVEIEVGGEVGGEGSSQLQHGKPMQHGKPGAGIDASCEGEATGNDAYVRVSCIRQALTQQFPELQPLLPSCRIAVDCEYVGPDASVPSGAEVALIPPVSGG